MHTCNLQVYSLARHTQIHRHLLHVRIQNAYTHLCLVYLVGEILLRYLEQTHLCVTDKFSSSFTVMKIGELNKTQFVSHMGCVPREPTSVTKVTISY